MSPKPIIVLIIESKEKIYAFFSLFNKKDIKSAVSIQDKTIVYLEWILHFLKNQNQQRRDSKLILCRKYNHSFYGLNTNR